jgi:uncharacterized membrane protein
VNIGTCCPGRASQQTHRAFLWGEGVITELGTLGGQWSQAEGINGVNDDDVTAGTHTCTAAGTAAHAVVWAGPGAAPPLLPDPATGTATMADAVNAQGEITGWAEAPDGSRRALVWRPASRSS